MPMRVCPPMVVKSRRKNLAVRLHRDGTTSLAFGLNESAKPVVRIEPGDVVPGLSADAA